MRSLIQLSLRPAARPCTLEVDYRGATGAGPRCLLIDPQRRHAVADEDRLESIFELPTRLLL